MKMPNMVDANLANPRGRGLKKCLCGSVMFSKKGLRSGDILICSRCSVHGQGKCLCRKFRQTGR